MKKIFTLMLAVLLCVAVFPVGYAAQSKSPEKQYETIISVETFTDGSYGVTTLSQVGNIGTKGKVTHTKSYTYYDSDNTMLWQVYLIAAFTYNGTSATCTVASVGHEIYNSAWQVTSETASKSGNTATGSFTVKRYLLGIPIKTINKTLTMSCSPSGVVS